MKARSRLAWAGGCGFLMALAAATMCNPAKSQTPNQPTEQNAAQGTSAATQNNKAFAIDSEMLTYSAMDAEGATVACNVARNLGAADDKCAPRGGMSNASGVVIVAGGSNALADFQLWRSDISTMDILTARANRYCPQQSQRGLISSIESMLSGFPVSQALSVAKALFTTTSVTTPLAGDILDQTLMNDVAGHLRAAGVPVVVPDTYMPHSLVTVNEARSPFLSKFLALMNARGCVDVKAEEPADQAKPQVGTPDRQSEIAAEREKRSVALGIDAFLQTLTEPEVSAMPEQPASTLPVAQPPTISHLNAVMRADGLAQEMGFDAKSAAGDNSPWDVLWLKSLESGGDVVASDNMIKGSKNNYTGGAVGTYALFQLNGELQCSGVFYNLAGPVLLTDIPKFVDGTQTAGPGRLVGGCTPK
ncbi:exported hypothetical protein [Candidatus Sulfotelmatomonas gaucii]|uniref:Lipoprotein n=1 Tax=Candidatus Sulfuritelmatomonas gaucii TaxID=2043161 RepID=A0A2N9L3Z3_9BACT|nr:exported hypothetical protein [Candidatus Sulfotelmatomonas gaucii]